MPLDCHLDPFRHLLNMFSEITTPHSPHKHLHPMSVIASLHHLRSTNLESITWPHPCHALHRVGRIALSSNQTNAFAHPKQQFLSHLDNPHGMKFPTPKGDALCCTLKASRVHDLQQFLGAVNYFHRFIPHAAELHCYGPIQKILMLTDISSHVHFDLVELLPPSQGYSFYLLSLTGQLSGHRHSQCPRPHAPPARPDLVSRLS